MSRDKIAIIHVYPITNSSGGLSSYLFLFLLHHQPWSRISLTLGW